MRAAVIPIWISAESKPAKVRLIAGDTEIHSGLEIIGRLDLRVNPNRRNFQFRQGEWKAIVGNIGNLGAFPLVQTARSHVKLG